MKTFQDYLETSHATDEEKLMLEAKYLHDIMKERYQLKTVSEMAKTQKNCDLAISLNAMLGGKVI